MVPLNHGKVEVYKHRSTTLKVTVKGYKSNAFTSFLLSELAVQPWNREMEGKGRSLQASFYDTLQYRHCQISERRKKSNDNTNFISIHL